MVEKDAPGFSTKLMTDKLSLRASITSELIFDECFIPETAKLNNASGSLGAALECLNQARFIASKVLVQL